MKNKLILIFCLIPFFVYGQNKNFTLGYKSNGVVFGNALKSNGLRLNVWDDYNTSSNNGINISVKSSSMQSNGVDIGLLFLADSVANGVQLATTVAAVGKANGVTLAGFFVGGETLNGISLAGIAVGADDSNINGIAISGLGAVGAHLNGLFIGLLGANNWSEPAVKVNGVALGFVLGVRAEKFSGFAAGIGNKADTTNGLTFGLFDNISNKVNGVQIGSHNKTNDLKGMQFGFYNETKSASGVQFGFLNTIEDKKIFKTLVLFNCKFRQMASR